MQIKPYLNEQIKEENEYEKKLANLFAFLLNALVAEMKLNYVTRARIEQVGNKWRQKYASKVNKLNVYQVNNCIQLVQDSMPKLQVTHNAIVPLTRDLTIATDNLYNSIVGRFAMALPAGSILAYSVINDGVLDELMKASKTSIARLAQNETSQITTHLLISTAINAGYTEYLPDNQHDDRVRETHRIENDGVTWYRFDNPPSSGYPSTEWGCRCIIKEVR